MNKLLDLRFIIGLFFVVVGILLLIFSLTSASASPVNEWCGALFTVFGLLMIVFSFRKDAHDELIEEGDRPHANH